MTAQPSRVVPIGGGCRLCGCRDLDDEERAAGNVCLDCQTRPEAKRLGSAPAGTKAARAFTPAEKSLIRKMAGYLPAADLLRILNERLHADLGPDAAPYTLDQLRGELQGAIDPGAGGDWAALRKLIAEARRTGVLATITATTVADFAVVFNLSPAQLMHVRDVIRHAKEDA